jgi:hypothetical protein
MYDKHTSLIELARAYAAADADHQAAYARKQELGPTLKVSGLEHELDVHAFIRGYDLRCSEEPSQTPDDSARDYIADLKAKIVAWQTLADERQQAIVALERTLDVYAKRSLQYQALQYDDTRGTRGGGVDSRAYHELIHTIESLEARLATSINPTP